MAEEHVQDKGPNRHQWPPPAVRPAPPRPPAPGPRARRQFSRREVWWAAWGGLTALLCLGWLVVCALFGVRRPFIYDMLFVLAFAGTFRAADGLAAMLGRPPDGK